MTGSRSSAEAPATPRRKPPKLDPALLRRVRTLFPELPATLPRKFPSLRVYGHRTLTRFGPWHKSILLVDNGSSFQLRFYAWKRNKQGIWKQRQNFNLTGGNIFEVLDVLQQLFMSFPEGLPKRRPVIRLGREV